MKIRTLPLFVSLLLIALPAQAQQPRIAALFPAGAKAGETVEVSVRGGGMAGAKSALVTGLPGVKAEVVGGGGTLDEKAKPLFQAKCTTCHEARSPANRSMSPEQWAQTVDRMINNRGADINKTDRDAIVNYLQAQAKAGTISLKFTVAPDAAPGMREVRVVTAQGVSTAYLFEVGGFPEIASAGTNSTPAQAQKLALPIVVNGTLNNNSERDYFSFDAKKGQRIAFNLKGFRLNAFAQTFFNPVLYLYDAKGKELAKNLGRFGLDPAFEWTAPEDGTYNILVRDMLWRGSPASVYRLAVGPLMADGLLDPVTARPGASVSARMLAGDGAASNPFTLRVPEEAEGVTMVSTPMGDAPLLVRDIPDRGGPNGSSGTPTALPGVFRGGIAKPGQVDVFLIKANKGQGLELYARRLGSPLRARVTVRNAEGRVVVARDAVGGEDPRIQNAFPAPGNYLVEISDVDGNAGPGYAYCWEALDGTPDFSINATPDGINIAPGGTLPILVRAPRRDNLAGPITLTVNNLPPGVTATPAIIAPEDDKTVIVLTAAPGITVQDRIVTITGSAPGADGTLAIRRARPFEILRINNQQRLLSRSTQIVAVTSDTPTFSLEVVGGNRIVTKQDQDFKIVVKVNRREGFTGDVVIGFLGLPPGIGGQNFVTVPRGKTEVTLTFHADGNARYLKDRPFPNLPPMEMVLVGFQGDNPLTCTPPLQLVGQ